MHSPLTSTRQALSTTHYIRPSVWQLRSERTVHGIAVSASPAVSFFLSFLFPIHYTYPSFAPSLLLVVTRIWGHISGSYHPAPLPSDYGTRLLAFCLSLHGFIQHFPPSPTRVSWVFNGRRPRGTDLLRDRRRRFTETPRMLRQSLREATCR